MKKVYYNKLVRDRLPSKVRRNGGTSYCFPLKVGPFEEELLKKVAEEAGGVSIARTREGIIDELGDLLDVIDELIRFKKITKKELVTARKHAFDIKGGFKRRLYMVWATDTKYRTNERPGQKSRRNV